MCICAGKLRVKDFKPQKSKLKFLQNTKRTNQNLLFWGETINFLNPLDAWQRIDVWAGGETNVTQARISDDVELFARPLTNLLEKIDVNFDVLDNDT